jgi:hypothetical protein
VHQDLREHYDLVAAQSTELKQRLGAESAARRQLETAQEQRVGDLRRAVEAKQREIENVQARMALPVDTDILRMKLQKDMEARHRAELQAKEQEVERVLEQSYETRRQLDIARAHLDAIKHEKEKEISDLQEKHRQEV